MPEHELGLTSLFNEYMPGAGRAVLDLFRIPVEDAAHPWPNWLVMELMVVAIIVVVFAVLRSSFSVDKPGKLQHIFEVLYGFLENTAEEIGIHHAGRYLPLFGTLFIFILFMNLIGIIPAFESPTMSPWVPAGLAVVTFLYYNYMGIRELGLIKYLAHFAGPVWWLAFLMIPIELVSHFARPLSLTVRLYGNMFAGEQVTDVFVRLTYLFGPAIFMALHVFVSFMQAYVFTLLTMIYVSGATAQEH